MGTFDDRVTQWVCDTERLQVDVASNLEVYRRLEAALGEDLKGVSLNCGCVFFSVAGDYECLLRTLRAFGREGMTATLKPLDKTPSYCAYFSTRDEDKKHIPGTPHVLLEFTSTVCKRVKVGERTVTEPVYDIVCGEPPTIDIAPAVAAIFNEPAEVAP
jgi:hypothetical protein